MKKNSFLRAPQKSLYLFPLLLIFLLFGCETDSLSDSKHLETDLTGSKAKNSAEKLTTFRGPAIPFYKGVAQSMVTMNHNGEPHSIGFRFSERSLDNLPMHMDEVTLELPKQANGLPFDHIDIGWTPNGHFPPGVYDVPHFDIHFYMISQEEKMEITDDIKAEILPEDQFIPQFYIPTDGYELYMGKHWINVLSDEFQGGIFTQTFIYGSYNGDFIFYEPMITLDFLRDKTSDEYAISQPAQFKKTGYYYPTRYSINYDETKKEYTVILEGLELK